MARGAIITFPDHMTKEQCEDILARMLKAGYCKPNELDNKAPFVHEYDPKYSSPCFYLP